MLTKVLRDAHAKAVEWPTAPAPDLGVGSPAASGAAAAELVRLQAEMAALESQLAAARADADRRVQEAQASSHALELSTRQRFEQQVEAEVGRLRQAIRDLASAAPRLRRRTEEDLVRLSVEIARRILRRTVNVDPDALAGLVKAAFDRLDRRETHQIRTHPENLAMVRRAVDGLALSRPVPVIADPSLQPGALLFETADGQLDASLETQLQEIERGFIDIVHHS